MLSSIPPEITIGSFSFLAIFAGYIWNDQSKKIEEIEKIQKNRPCHSIHLSVIKISNDIEWIKKKLK